MANIKALILANGINVAGWTFSEDSTNNLRFTDLARNGYYRFIKTSEGRNVKSVWSEQLINFYF